MRATTTAKTTGASPRTTIGGGPPSDVPLGVLLLPLCPNVLLGLGLILPVPLVNAAPAAHGLLVLFRALSSIFASYALLNLLALTLARISGRRQ
jgi:hypothetical protein